MGLVIAIDGPAAAGKGTLATRLAAHFHLAKLDTGLLYRATGFKVLSAGGDVLDAAAATKAAKALHPDDLLNPALRGDEAASAASKVSAVPGVRAALLQFQRDFAENPPNLPAGSVGGPATGSADGIPAKGAILDGRDIGTTVCPDATAKVFVTASTEIRAKRRFKELQERGHEAIYARVLDEMKERDARDTSRSASPLVAAADALVLDTSDMDADQAFGAACDFIAAKIASSPRIPQ